MNPKVGYRYFLSRLKKAIVKIELLKSLCAERIAIWHKRKFWKKIHWSEDEQEKFDNYWQENYGHKISNKWARLYQNQSGVYQENYVSEMMFSSYLEPALNDYYYSDVLADKGLLELLCSGVGISFPRTVTGCSGGYYYDSQHCIISSAESYNLICECLKVKRGG